MKWIIIAFVIGILDVLIISSSGPISEDSVEFYGQYIPKRFDFTYQKYFSKMLILSNEIQEINKVAYECNDCEIPNSIVYPYLYETGFYDGDISFGDYAYIVYLKKIIYLNDNLTFFEDANDRIGFFYSVYEEKPIGDHILFVEEHNSSLKLWQIGDNKEFILNEEAYKIGNNAVQEILK